jgi:hypothetical protein
MVLQIDAHDLALLQLCPRQWLLDRSYRPLRWQPRRLANAILWQGVLAMAGGTPAEEAAAEARSQFLQSAANPGLDITTDPFAAAREWCAMLDSLLRSIAREGVPSLQPLPPVRLTSQLEWQPLAQSDGQTLHRWLMIDRWGEDDLSRELHSWKTLGDIATTRLPMTIHVLEIGRMWNGRRSSPWTRGWKHPTMPSLPMRFKGKTKNAFKSWKPVYLAGGRVDADDWVEQLWTEGAAQELMKRIEVRAPSDAQAAQVVRDILMEASRMRVLEEERTHWSALPMSRGACDLWQACPFQSVCYSPEPPQVVRVEELGFQMRSA